MSIRHDEPNFAGKRLDFQALRQLTQELGVHCRQSKEVVDRLFRLPAVQGRTDSEGRGATEDCSISVELAVKKGSQKFGSQIEVAHTEVSLSQNELSILRFLARKSPVRMKIYDIAADAEVARKTASAILNHFVELGLASWTKRKGASITVKGFDFLSRYGLLPLKSLPPP